MRPASCRSGSGSERGLSLLGGGGGMRPWLARGGFGPRSPPRCARTGSARSNAKVTGKTNGRFIFFSSNRLRTDRFKTCVNVDWVCPEPSGATHRGCLPGTVVEVQIENWKIQTKERASRGQRPCDDERGIRRV